MTLLFCPLCSSFVLLLDNIVEKSKIAFHLDSIPAVENKLIELPQQLVISLCFYFLCQFQIIGIFRVLWPLLDKELCLCLDTEELTLLLKGRWSLCLLLIQDLAV
jgi:hypothetical protein